MKLNNFELQEKKLKLSGRIYDNENLRMYFRKILFENLVFGELYFLLDISLFLKKEKEVCCLIKTFFKYDLLMKKTCPKISDDVLSFEDKVVFCLSWDKKGLKNEYKFKLFIKIKKDLESTLRVELRR